MTALQGEFVGEEHGMLLKPFGVKFWANVAEPNMDDDTITQVTMEHLVHSFRAKDWHLDHLTLLVLEKENRNLMHSSVVASVTPQVLSRRLTNHPTNELVFGGTL